MRTPLAIGVIGLSDRGARLADIFDELPRAELRLLCDSDPQLRAREARRHSRATVVADPAHLFEDEVLDATVIAGPVTTHYPLAAAAIDSGKHVFVVDPLAVTGEEADELVRLAENADRRLVVGHRASFDPAVRKLRELVQAGSLGEVYYLAATCLGDDVRGLIAGPFADAIASMMDVLGDQPIEVAVHADSYHRPGVPDVATGILRFATGISAHALVSRVDPREGSQVIAVGSEAAAVLDETEWRSAVTVYEHLHGAGGHDSGDRAPKLGDVIVPRVAREDPDVVACERFVSAVRSASFSRDNAREAAAVVHVLGAAARSMEAAGRPEVVAATVEGATVIELPV
jgi:predicted dehydrogenase